MRKALLLGSAFGLASIAPAAAQPIPAEDDAQLEEIVVTAQKVSQSLQDVRAAVTAITGEALSDLQNRTIEDVTAQTPGLSFSRAGGQSFIHLPRTRPLTPGIG